MTSFTLPSDPRVVLAVSLLLAYLTYLWINSETNKLRHIPTVGSPGLIGSYIDSWRFMRQGYERVQEGYEKFYGKAFKITMGRQYMVFASGPEMYTDIRKAPEHTLSLRGAFSEIFQADYLLVPQVRTEPFHVPVIHNTLTRNLAHRFEDMTDEVCSAFGELIPMKSCSEAWHPIPVWKTVEQCICRTSHRIFVGLPLCRDPEYRKLNETFNGVLFKGAFILNMFPRFLKPLVASILTNVPRHVDRMVAFIEPVIRERLDKEKEFGADWPDKPNDLIQWLLEESTEEQRTARQFTARLLMLNFAAMHTTTMALTNAIYDLARYPEYVAPLREEIEGILKTDGWTRASQAKMIKLDSFLKESQRLTIGASMLTRLAVEDFTFSNGTTVPAGTMIAFATKSTHDDPMNFNDPEEFQGFRFAELREKDGDAAKHQMVALSPEYVLFGTGRFACPGRFFVVDELKSMLVHILLNYDVKLADGQGRPRTLWFGTSCTPDPKAKILFRQRTK